MIDLILIALFQAAAGDPAPAQNPAATPQATEDAAQTAEGAQGQEQTQTEERRRCRRELVVGTRMTHRVCTTASEDRAAAREARDFVQDAQSQTPLQGN
jgi:hypothetical protein